MGLRYHIIVSLLDCPGMTSPCRQYLYVKKVMQKYCLWQHKLLVCLRDFDQTKCICHCPWCGHDTYALGWGVIKPQAMVGAYAPPLTMVTPVFLNYYVAEGFFGPGMFLCRIMYNRKSHNKKHHKHVNQGSSGVIFSPWGQK
jgi:hypothetical protein